MSTYPVPLLTAINGTSDIVPLNLKLGAPAATNYWIEYYVFIEIASIKEIENGVGVADSITGLLEL